VLLLRQKNGEFALSAVYAPRLHRALEPEQQKIQCPCHAGVFTPDGTVVSGPPPRPLASYPTQLVAGRLRITT
jgi:cytochrome b6-f complex iron-sulfur subunit